MALQAWPAAQLTPAQGSVPQVPCTQRSGATQEVVAQLGSQTPPRHAWSAAQVTLAQGSSTHAMATGSQICPSEQPRPRQSSLTQRPAGSVGSQIVPAGQVAPSQWKVQALFLHTQAETPTVSGAHTVVPMVSVWVSPAQAVGSQAVARQKHSVPIV